MNGTLIYEPRGRAREYAPLACNLYGGCDHACTYCYAPDAVHKDRAGFATPHTRGDDFLTRLDKEGKRLATAHVTGQVLLCFTCDPYQHLDVAERLSREAIRILHRHGFPVSVLTKGGSRALRDINLFFNTDAFATTLTLLSDKHSLAWEPGAALPEDRIETLQAFHKAGIPTWVSLEPVLNPESTLELIRRTHPFVDLYKVGTLNHHPLAKTIDWRKFAVDATTLLASLGKQHYIKDDLRAYLPL